MRQPEKQQSLTLGPNKHIPAAKIHFPEQDIELIQKGIADILRSGQLVLGKHVVNFENRFAERIEAKNPVAVSSGTAALEIALRTLQVEGKKVIVPVNTFYASAGAVLHAGGKLGFADIKPETMSLDIDSVNKQIDPETAAVMIVHIGGVISPDILKLKDLCHSKGIKLIEDAAHAHGSSYNNLQAGTIGDIGTFSFFPTKVMTSFEGGMIVTPHQDLAEEAKIYRDQGKAASDSNYHTHLGYAWRMSEIHALAGLTQLERLTDFIAHRQKIAAIYDAELGETTGIKPLENPEGVNNNYYKYVVNLEDSSIDRAKLKQLLKKRFQISLSGEIYEIPLHQQPIFQEKFTGGPFPTAEQFCARHVCLPVSAVMTEEEAKYVADVLKYTLKHLQDEIH